MLTHDRLTELLTYEPDTGLFRWKVKRPGKYARIGAVAGKSARSPARYVQIKIDRRFYLAHRLAWFWCHREWPAEQVDHINNDRFDNRIANLRLATPQQNCWNQRARVPGWKGTTRIPNGKWMARIGTKYLGLFETRDDAHAAYQDAARSSYGEFAKW